MAETIEKLIIMKELKKLNIGCGTDIKKGWINLDSVNIPGVDIVYDVEKTPLPFKDEEFDEILCQDIMEHLDYIPLLRELYRILKKGSKLRIRVPHFTSAYNFIDPTHKRFFSFRTFEFFIKNHERSYYFDVFFDRITYSRIELHKGFGISGRKMNFLIKKLEKWINSSRKRKCLYEDGFLSRLFPGGNIIVELIK